jgi:predicted membrane-bound spermidine synthase
MTKVLRPALAGEALRNFRLIARASPSAGRAAGAAECSIAFAVVMQPRLGLVIASLTLASFAALIAARLRDNAAFACFCFGDETSPVSRVSVARALLLGLVAASSELVILVGEGEWWLSRSGWRY